VTPEGPGELFVPQALLAAASALAHYPAVRVGTVTFEGRELWKHVLERAVPAERWELLQSLEQHLLAALPVGKERLREGMFQHASDPRPYTYGDSWLGPMLRDALEFLPARVRSVCCREAAWLAVGRESVAWTSSALFIAEDGVARRRVVVCGPDTWVKTLLHESVHVWFADVHSDVPALSSEGAAALVALAEREDWADRIDDNLAMHEVLATALSTVWLWRAPEGKPA
jgi:hypothetical protein